MTVLADLLEKYPPRLVKPHEIRNNEAYLEPFDFFIVEDWEDMQMMCSDSFAPRDLKEDPSEIELARNHLNPTPFYCSHGGQGKYGYKGSTFVMLPYTLDVSHSDLMDTAAHVFKQFMDTHHFVFRDDVAETI